MIIDVNNLREKFSPGTGFESGSPAYMLAREDLLSSD